MKALILVGGFGTRLRPLTFSCLKPFIEFCNKPIIAYQIEALAKVGVKEIILAIQKGTESTITQYIVEFEKEFNVKIICSVEDAPLFTAGPIKLAEKILRNNNQEGCFFVFNCDVICEYHLEKLLQMHKQHKKQGTIMFSYAEEPSQFGVIINDEDGKITQFIEKPKQFISSKINAGLYLFNLSVLDRIPIKPCSLEFEIFPKMVEDQELYTVHQEDFWCDVGIPKNYLNGIKEYLAYLNKKFPNQLARGKNILGNVLIHPTAKVDEDTIIGPDVTIGPYCQIGEGVRLQKSCLLEGSIIKDNSWVSDTIIGWKSVIGSWNRIEGITVFGSNVCTKDELFIAQSKIFHDNIVTQNITKKDTIIL